MENKTMQNFEASIRSRFARGQLTQQELARLKAQAAADADYDERETEKLRAGDEQC